MLYQNRRRQFFFLLVIAASQLIGCSDTSGPKLVSVSGTIEYKGQPVEYGMVAFSPVNPESGRVTTSEIVSGRYTMGENEGLKVGDYNIVIVSAGKASDGTGLIPKKYSNAETSGLKVSISKSDTTTVKNFNLED